MFKFSKMKFRLLFFLSILLIGWHSIAQKDSLSTKYREDQFYVSVALQLQQENIKGFKQNGFSNNFQVGFIRDIPLNSKGTVAVGMGLGYTYNRLFSNLRLQTDSNHTLFSVQENEKNLQTYSSLDVPLSFRYRTSTPDRTDFWRIYGGMKYKLNFAAKYIPFYGKAFKYDFIRKNNTAVFLSMGYNTWNIFFEYYLNSIYAPGALLPSGASINLHTYQLGLIFYIL